MLFNFCVLLDSPKRVDLYLSTLFSDFSRSYIQKIIDSWFIKINSETVKRNIKIKNKDEISMEIIVKSLDIKPENIPLDIVYENSDIIIVNKDPHINTHPVPGEDWKSWTLVNALLYHTKDLASIWWVERPGIIHRLDKETSWLIMIAKNDKMMKYLQETIKQRQVDKYYIAIVDGIVKDKEFKIESYIWRHKIDKTKMTTKNPVNPKIAISHVKTISYIDNKYSVLEVKLETGRTHQIRVHLSSIWHFILGDKVYGNSKVNNSIKTKYALKRQALHAYKLWINLYWEKRDFIWELKSDMKKIIWDLDI